jgi:hypothetical protein
MRIIHAGRQWLKIRKLQRPRSPSGSKMEIALLEQVGVLVAVFGLTAWSKKTQQLQVRSPGRCA